MDQIIGTCSECGGPVAVPSNWMGINPPIPTCKQCGVREAQPYGPVIKMKPKPSDLLCPPRIKSNLTAERIRELQREKYEHRDDEPRLGDPSCRSSFNLGFLALMFCALALPLFAADPTPEQLATMREFGLSVPPVLYDVHGKIKGEPSGGLADIVPVDGETLAKIRDRKRAFASAKLLAELLAVEPEAKPVAAIFSPYVESAPKLIAVFSPYEPEPAAIFSPYVEPAPSASLQKKLKQIDSMIAACDSQSLPSINPKENENNQKILLDFETETGDKTDRLGSASMGPPESLETPPPLSEEQLNSGPRQKISPVLSIKTQPPSPKPVPPSPTEEQLQTMRENGLSMPPTLLDVNGRVKSGAAANIKPASIGEIKTGDATAVAGPLISDVGTLQRASDTGIKIIKYKLLSGGDDAVSRYIAEPADVDLSSMVGRTISVTGVVVGHTGNGTTIIRVRSASTFG